MINSAISGLPGRIFPPVFWMLFLDDIRIDAEHPVLYYDSKNNLKQSKL